MRLRAAFIGFLFATGFGQFPRALAYGSRSGEFGRSVERHVFTDGARYLVVEALDDDLLHFEMAIGAAPDPERLLYATPMVAKSDYPGPSNFLVHGRTVETAEMSATVAADLCVTVVDKIRQQTLHTLCPKDLEQTWKGFSLDSPGARNVYGLGQYFSDEAMDGDWIGRVWDPLHDGFGARLRGFAGGANNFSMFPVMYALGDGSKGYALFLDQVYKQMWDFRAAPWQVGMWGDQIRWYVLSGPDLPDLRRDYMELTGRPPVPPKRSFGLWVSEFGFRNWDEVNTELADLRRVGMPVDGFALDLQWFGGTFGDPDQSRMGSLTFDDRAFPDAADEIRRLKDEQGVNLMLIEEPYVSETLAEHGEMGRRGYLARGCETCPPAYLDQNPWWGRGGMVDFTSPEGAAFWHDYRREPLAAMGINDHWADLGEPEQYVESSWYHGFPELQKHGHSDVHNIYGFKWMQSIADGYQRNRRTERPFLLSRTGTSGIQRFGAGIWSGDIGTNWGNLRSQMQVQMHMSLSGVDYYGSDVGGFQRNPSVPGGERLYTQWLAASAALDVPLRPHAWNLDKARATSPSRRGNLAANLESVRLRYRLSPYYYSLAHAAHRSGDPVFPPLVHYFQTDLNVRRIGSEKMIGPGLLVAVAADSGAVSREVYLPAGEWADFHTLEWTSSRGQTIRGVPLYAPGHLRLPLYARAGAIVPMMAVDSSTLNVRGRRSDGAPSGDLQVRVFASPEATSFDLVEDDGETVGYLRGETATTRISQVMAGDEARVTIAAVSGRYPRMPGSRSIEVEVAIKDRRARAVTLNGAALSECVRERLGSSACFSRQDGFTLVRTGMQRANMTRDVRITTSPVQVVKTSGYFVCRNAPVGPGRSVYVTGSSASLGTWDVSRGVRLSSVEGGTWAGRIGDLPASTRIEWKCVVRADGLAEDTVWQPGDNNVLVTAPSGYSGETAAGF